MPEIQKVSIALTGEQIASLKRAVDSGEYATTSENVREALRDWQRRRELHAEEVEQLRRRWEEGKQSGAAAVADLGKVRQKARQRLEQLSKRPVAHG